MKKVLFTSFESLPFAKVGGLADVVYALPKAINKKNYKVDVVLPLFKSIKDNYKLKFIDTVKIRNKSLSVNLEIYSCKNETIRYYFIGNNKYFNRKEVYGYKDDVIRFAIFNLGVVEMMRKLNYYPDICHEHDYHTSMIPLICKYKYGSNPKINNVKHVLTIHNLAYQGWYKKNVLKNYFGFDNKLPVDKNILIRNTLNFMKAGISYSNAITTVSPTYSKEIQTKKYGYDLSKVLKDNKKKLSGIVNGIDTSLFNPKKDKCIAYKYDISSYKAAKQKNKLFLQKKLGLEINKDVLLIGMVSRLTFQKGADIIVKSINKLLKTNVQIIILGTGEKNIEESFKDISRNNKNRFAYYCGYNETLAHQMYAGLDLLLMPSKFEPCGISQLIAMHYGTLPLVRKTGGLKDTVVSSNKNINHGTGFVFEKYTTKDFLKAFYCAYNLFYKSPHCWRKLINNAMKTDVSFKKSAKEYEKIYTKIMK